MFPSRKSPAAPRLRVERTAGVFLLTAALAVQGLSGIAGDLGLIMDPSGGALGIPAAWLEGSPFGSYLVPGLTLFFVLGVVPLAVAWAVWARRD